MQMAFYLAGEITQVKESIPGVRCASGNVLEKIWWKRNCVALKKNLMWEVLMCNLQTCVEEKYNIICICFQIGERGKITWYSTTILFQLRQVFFTICHNPEPIYNTQLFSCLAQRTSVTTVTLSIYFQWLSIATTVFLKLNSHNKR